MLNSYLTSIMLVTQYKKKMILKNKTNAEIVHWKQNKNMVTGNKIKL